MKALTDLLHILLCRMPHTYDVMKINIRQFSDGLCYFYLENDIDGGEEMPDHLQWHEVSEKFKTSLSFKSDEEALNFLKDVIRLGQDSRKLANGDMNRLKFIQSILT